MKQVSGGGEMGRQVMDARKHWVQTERKSHEAWGKLALKKPAASAVLHQLIANMGEQNAVVISQTLLAKLVGVSDRTITSAIQYLAADKWIQVVKLGRGRECAYVVNDQVAWAETRSKLWLSKFSAEIVADAEDQSESTMERAQLRKIPVVYDGERQLPTGDGLPPPSQPSIPGMEPDLPSRRRKSKPAQIDIEEAIAELPPVTS